MSGERGDLGTDPGNPYLYLGLTLVVAMVVVLVLAGFGHFILWVATR